MSIASVMSTVSSAIRSAMGRLGRRGSVTILFAAAAVPMVIGTAVAVDFSRMTSARATLQEAADGAALSGAAAYAAYAQGDAFNSVAQSLALSSFCNAAKTLPAGFSITASSGSLTCGSQAGPAVSAVIAGARAGTRGVIAGSGCSATNTVVTNATCGFVVTVSAVATMNLIFPGLLGTTKTVSVTSSAINPFINIAQALNSSLQGSAKFANSIWIYPLLLDANGSPAVTSANPGALPDASACTGDPTQTACGAYSMLASTNYAGCPGQTVPSCTVNGTTFGAGGVVQNPAAGATVITATTPLGVAFASVSGGGYSGGLHANYGYDRNCRYYQTCPLNIKFAPDLCVWPWHTVYNTVSQVYSPTDTPIYPWSLVTHWYYSSYLSQNMPPSQGIITTQLTTATNPATGYPYNYQIVRATPQVVLGLNVPPLGCITPIPDADYQRYVTTFPTTGNSNCSLYIAKDPPANPTPDSSYTGSCFSPSATPGQSYAALSCQRFSGHSFAFFWNDMGGGDSDDKNYGNGTLVITCAAQSQVKLIN